MRRGGSLLAVLLALAAAGLCVRLGFWQLGRWQAKRAALAAAATRAGAPVQDVYASWELTPAAVGTRLRVHGQIDERRHVLLAGRIDQGEPGVALVSVFALEGGGHVLLERGWLPALDARDADPRAVASRGPQVLLTQLDSLPGTPLRAQWLPLPGEPTRWSVGRLTLGGVRTHLGDSLAPFRLVALPEPGAPARPKRVAPAAPDATMHLSYALQWFLFAAGIVGATAFVAWRRRGADRA